ncbi:MAG: SCO family protein [Chromatiales bacterium]|nr:SCO family protein [Chromatiales bacterium]
MHRHAPAQLGLLAAMALTLAGSLLPARASVTPGNPTDGVVEANPAQPITDFELTDHNGKPFRLSRLQGRPVLVFFGFTNCPVACPAAMGRLLAASRSADPAVREARVVMISTDGERDTPAVMKQYLARLSPDFIGLTGPPKEVGRIAAQFSAVFFRGRAADESGNYLVEHTTQIYLLDRAGRLRATFFDAPVDTLARVTGAVAAEQPASHNPR